MDKINLPKDILEIHKIFDNNGFKLFVVGGAVRDHIMNKTPHDFDLVTDATPEQVMSILSGYRTDLQGAQFGVVRVFTKDCPEGHEIASYRKDISLGRDNKSDSDKVEIGKHITIEDDVLRRDLTQNALFYDIKNGEIVDLVGGIDDIKNKIIRTVGNPIDRFNEDRLRIIRTIRFSATTNSKIDKDTEDAIRKDNRLFGISSIDDVSKERIYAEFEKVREKSVSNTDPYIMKRFFDMLIEFGIMEQLYPSLSLSGHITQTFNLNIALAQVLLKNEVTPKFTNILGNSKMSNNQLNIVSLLINIYNNGITSDNAYTTFMTMKAKNISIDILYEWFNIIRFSIKTSQAFLNYTPTTSGKDVMEDGFKGVSIGDEIKRREKVNFENLLNSIK